MEHSPQQTNLTRQATLLCCRREGVVILLCVGKGNRVQFSAPVGQGAPARLTSFVSHGCVNELLRGSVLMFRLLCTYCGAFVLVSNRTLRFLFSAKCCALRFIVLLVSLRHSKPRYNKQHASSSAYPRLGDRSLLVVEGRRTGRRDSSDRNNASNRWMLTRRPKFHLPPRHNTSKYYSSSQHGRQHGSRCRPTRRWAIPSWRRHRHGANGSML